MSSIIDISPGPQRGNNELFDYKDGKGLILVHENDDRQINWNLTDWLASGETVSSASYADSGASTSGKSVSSPTITFTITKYGYTRVTATLSTGRNITRYYYTLAPNHAKATDYQG